MKSSPSQRARRRTVFFIPTVILLSKLVLGALICHSGVISVNAQPAAPTISGFLPVTGHAGTTVRINGTGLTNIISVQFNGVDAAFSLFGGFLFATVPQNATTGPVSVTTAAGMAVSAENFSVSGQAGPVVTAFSPASGEVGVSVEIQGSGFAGLQAVRFNGVNAAFTMFAGNILATVPASASSGPITVVTSTGSFTTTQSFTVKERSGPVISGFLPTSGEPGTIVEIKGANFAGASSVQFQGVEAAFNLLAGSIFATVPTNAVSGSIKVVTDVGTAVSAESFTVLTVAPPQITSFTPQKGSPGDAVDIRGSKLDDVTAVLFDGAEARFTNIFPGLITAYVPTNAPTGPITVTSANGSHTTAEIFTAINPLAPIITGFSPESGRPGDLIDLRGTNLTGATRVLFNGVEGLAIPFNAERMFATVPEGAQSGPVTVWTTNGRFITEQAFVVEGSVVLPPPTLSIQVNAENRFELSWEIAAAGFRVQETADLTLQDWRDLGSAPTIIGDRAVVTVDAASGTRFYRLRQAGQ